MKPREIIIRPVMNGFVVQSGCQQVVFRTPAELGAAITEYYTNPGEVERRYIKEKINDTMDHCAPSMDACEAIRAVNPMYQEPALTAACAESPRAPRP